MDRLDQNLAILEILRNYLEAHPDERFGQALRNTRIVTEKLDSNGLAQWNNHFMEESTAMLSRVTKTRG